MPHNTEGQIPGWNSYAPIFAELIASVQPHVIIEVGSWMGASACHMASLAPTALIYCVDTFEGSAEHQGPSLPRDSNGRITLLDTFNNNVRDRGHQDHIVTVVSRSVAAAENEFKSWGFLADLIYIDGSHAYEDVKADLAAYWPLLRSGGVMFGDDYIEWPTVRRAVDEFGIPVVNGNHWHFVKP